MYRVSTDLAALKAQNTDFRRLAESGVELFFTQLFRDNFFHADMHPGNIFVSRAHPQNPQYIAIDFGIVGSLSTEDKDYLAHNLMAFFNRDYRKVAQLHIDSGWVAAGTRVEDFEAAVRTVCEPIFELPLKDISFGHLLPCSISKAWVASFTPNLICGKPPSPLSNAGCASALAPNKSSTI